MLQIPQWLQWAVGPRHRSSSGSNGQRVLTPRWATKTADSRQGVPKWPQAMRGSGS